MCCPADQSWTRIHIEADWDTYAPLFGAEAYRLEIAESEQRWRRDQGKIVGLGHAFADRIDALYLLSKYHRQGIGKALLSRLLAFLHDGGVREARFDVVAVNASAIAFYEAQGARPLGCCINRDPRGDTEDLIFSITTAKGGCKSVP